MHRPKPIKGFMLLLLKESFLCNTTSIYTQPDRNALLALVFVVALSFVSISFVHVWLLLLLLLFVVCIHTNSHV